MKRVRRADAASLERGRDVVDAGRELGLRPVHGRPYASESSSVPARGARGRSSSTATHRSGARRSRSRRGRESGTACTGSTRSPRAGSRSRTTSSRARSPARALEARAAALRRATGLLGGYPGDFATVLACRASDERRRRRLLDGRHRRHPVDAPRPARASSGRRSSTRRSACRSGWSSSRPRGGARLPRRVPPPAHDRRVRRRRGGRAAGLARRGRARRSSSCRSASTPNTSGPIQQPRRRPTSCPSEPIRAGTTTSCSRSRGAGRTGRSV